jgi:hypothetical protein
MQSLGAVISFTTCVLLLLAVRPTPAQELRAVPSPPAMGWLEDGAAQEPGELSTQAAQPFLMQVQWGAGGQRTVRCESQNDRYAYCPTYTSGRVRLQRQLSNSPCRQYETWGEEGNGSGVWVRNGCRAIFVVGRGGGGGGGGGGWDGGGDSGRTVTCKSEGFRYNRCPVYRGGRKVRLSRQLSDASCVRGSSWGVERDGIWVNNGCSAEFTLR